MVARATLATRCHPHGELAAHPLGAGIARHTAATAHTLRHHATGPRPQGTHHRWTRGQDVDRAASTAFAARTTCRHRQLIRGLFQWQRHHRGGIAHPTQATATTDGLRQHGSRVVPLGRLGARQVEIDPAAFTAATATTAHGQGSVQGELGGGQKGCCARRGIATGTTTAANTLQHQPWCRGAPGTHIVVHIEQDGATIAAHAASATKRKTGVDGGGIGERQGRECRRRGSTTHATAAANALQQHAVRIVAGGGDIGHRTGPESPIGAADTTTGTAIAATAPHCQGHRDQGTAVVAVGCAPFATTGANTVRHHAMGMPPGSLDAAAAVGASATAELQLTTGAANGTTATDASRQRRS